ncbi:MAG: hypothetical protein K2X32_14120, partial [Phycisphaerales bacterium]|nr:hypothetical protein [Phycisphaerales bacterium]
MASWTDWTVASSKHFINGAGRCIQQTGSVLKANSANWQSALRSVYLHIDQSAVGETAKHGLAIMSRRMSQLNQLGELDLRLEKLRGNLGTNATDAQKLAADGAMRRAPEGFEATLRTAGTTTGPSVKAVDDAIANIDRVPTNHLRSLVNDHVGEGKAFANMQEFEAMRMLPVEHLN